MIIAALVEELRPGSPAQQLVDRLLMGFPTAGEMRPPRAKGVVVHAPAAVDQEEIARRGADFGLQRRSSVEAAVAEAEAILVAPAGAGDRPAEGLVETAIRAARRGSRVFVHGVLAGSAAAARRMADLAASRGVSLLAGGCMPCTWRLPPVDVEWGAELSEALIVTVGEPGEAELLGADGLMALVERRAGGESGVRAVRFLGGEAVWNSGAAGEWPRALLAAALSRSDTPQGDALRDGRTQDLVGLGLVEKLAPEPAVFVIEHADGLRSAVLVLNGVIADINFAVRSKSGATVSAQLYRPAPPASHQFSALAAVVERFFADGKLPWPVERCILAAGILDAFRRARSRPGERVETPELAVRYGAEPASCFERE